MKELPPRETKDNKTFKSFKTVGLSTPFPVYAVHNTANESVERLRLPEENDVSSAIAVPQRVVSIQSVDGAKNQILKNIQSLSTKLVLHDPQELFVHLCASTCDGKRQ